MPELLLEILSEEIPARMQSKAASDLKRLVTDSLEQVGLVSSRAEAFVTPRRLALVVDGLPAKTPSMRGERRGPRTDASEQAVAGFTRSLPEGAVIEERETPKGNVLFASWEEAARGTRDVLAECLPEALRGFPWPKSMRWATHEMRWVRPIESLIALFDGAVVDFEFGAVRTGAETRGHRFLAGNAFAVSDFHNYKAKLINANVMLDPAARRDLIRTEATKLAKAEGLTLKHDPSLLNEVMGLVEWPVVYMGAIDDAFMDVPAEALITSMKKHQRYFSCLDADGNLANRFVVVANTETMDGGKEVVAGNERVLRARLSDAKFFWDNDRKTPLEGRVSALKDRVFHARLGSLADKAARMEALAAYLAKYVPGVDVNQASRVAQLAKADLSSGMVAEFANLQGIMGRYYALNDGEPKVVAEAIADHYAPQGPNDMCPTAPISVCVALADKIDSLVGFFAIDEKPSGSKDPFALRRAALGVIRLVLENELRLPLIEVFTRGYQLIGTGDNPADELMAFLADRLKVHLRERGISHDRIDSVFALGGEDDLFRLLARVDALIEFLVTEDGENLLTAYRRAANILKIEEKKDRRTFDGEVQRDKLAQAEETNLHVALCDSGPAIARAITNEDFAAAMKMVAALRAPVDSFFDHVTVNVDDATLRENRLKLLNQIRSALDGVADFSKIEG